MASKFINFYLAFLKPHINVAKPLKVIFDCSGGPVGLILERLFAKTDCPIKYKLINFVPDGNFPAKSNNPLSPKAAKQLKDAVSKEKADLGVIFDADGDRAVFIDNRGQVTPFYLIAQLLSLENSASFVFDVINFKIFEKLPFKAKRIFESKVGYKLVEEVMRKEKADIGVEYSGHYYFKDFFYATSGILAALKVINAVSRLPYSLADFPELMPRKFFWNQFNIISKNGEETLKKVKKYFKKGALKISKLDGLTFDFGDWFFNARLSNTENSLLRFYVGSLNRANLENSVKQIKLLVS